MRMRGGSSSRRRRRIAARSAAALAYYRELYAIEKEIKAEIAKLPEDADEADAGRDPAAGPPGAGGPVLEDFETWLEAERPNVLPKSPLGGAIGYMRNNWEALEAVHRARATCRSTTTCPSNT